MSSLQYPDTQVFSSYLPIILLLVVYLNIKVWLLLHFATLRRRNLNTHTFPEVVPTLSMDSVSLQAFALSLLCLCVSSGDWTIIYLFIQYTVMIFCFQQNITKLFHNPELIPFIQHVFKATFQVNRAFFFFLVFIQ